MDEHRHWYADGLDAEELAFQRLYGPVLPSTPRDAVELFEGFGRPWWIAGGWAVEAFTGMSREHEDVDVSIFLADVHLFRRHVGDRYHVWAVNSGTLRPMTDDRPELLDGAEQMWLREHALAPWRYDVALNPDRGGRWIFRRDPELDFDLDEVTWVARDGIRYITPQMALAYKARLDRPRDQVDLAAALPLLDDRQRTWLRDTVTRLHPGHHWLELI